MPGRPKSRSKSKPEGTNSQRELFVQEYIQLREINATEAARRAGVPTKGACDQAKRWLKLKCVQTLLEQYREERKKRVYVDASQLVLELAIIGHSTMEEALQYVVFDDIGIPRLTGAPDHVGRAVKKLSGKRSVKFTPGGENQPDSEIVSTDVSIEMYDKPKAIQLLMGHLGITEPKDEDKNKAVQSLADFLMSLPKPKPPETKE